MGFLATFFSTASFADTSVKGPGAFDSHAFFRCMNKTSTQLKKGKNSTALNNVVNIGRLTQETLHESGGYKKYHYDFETLLFSEFEKNEVHIHVLQDPRWKRSGKSVEATFVVDNKHLAKTCDKSASKIHLPMATKCQLRIEKVKSDGQCKGPDAKAQLELSVSKNPPSIFCNFTPSTSKNKKTYKKKKILNKKEAALVAEKAFIARLNYLKKAIGKDLIYDQPEIEEALSRNGDCLLAFGSSMSVRKVLSETSMKIICKMKGKDLKSCMMPKGHH